MSWVPLALLAPGSAYLLFNDAALALRQRVRIVEGLSTPVSRQFVDG